MRRVWRLSLAGGDALEADVLVPACGQLSRPVRPALPGLDRFPGPVFHSAEWDHGVDLDGRRVAVIGTGASAIQVVPAVVDRVAALTVFQHVDVVTAPIAEVTATGVRTADGGDHPADVIVLGTGFASTEFLAPMKVFGPGGRELSEQWRDGASAHLGTAVPGFPNLFLLYGPNTNLGSGSIVHMLECQIGYVRQALELLCSGVRTLTVRPEVADRFDAEIQQRLARSVWTGCRSWYRTAAGRVVNNWPGTMREYGRRTRRFEASEYEAGPACDRRCT